MATSPRIPVGDEAHLVTLVLQSKKALQHGEALCLRASSLSKVSSQSALDVLALDAKVRWITDAVMEQFKLAADVAKSIERTRSGLEKQAREWDVQRTQRSDTLDGILDALASQRVPPSFHAPSAPPSLFGSQLSDEDDGAVPHSPLTVRGELPGRVPQDRAAWRTLRDFVDERAIEDVVEKLEEERTSLDDLMSSSAGYPETIMDAISAMRNLLPTAGKDSLTTVQDTLRAQEVASTGMARHLENLTTHYDQMAEALRDSEAGEVYSAEDMLAMNRDVDELPSIIAELEQSAAHIQSHYDRLLSLLSDAQKCLDAHKRIMDDLDELGEIMAEMLERQQDLERACETQLLSLHDYLYTLENLYTRFSAYQLAYNKMLVEIGRRREYRETAEAIVRSMVGQLEAMSQEERVLRETWKGEHGEHLPTDLCLCIENPPTKWGVVPVPWDGEGEAGPAAAEFLPELANDLLLEARDKIAGSEGIAAMLGSAGSASV